jgi:outer membrane protein OmpA-like peptidoglycan-associated protein
MREAPETPTSDAVASWNVEASRRPEQPLEPKERAERQKVGSMPGAIGRPFDKPPTEKAVREWYDKRSPAEKKALNNPAATVTLTCTASLTGDAAYNQALTQKSGEVTKQIMEERLGVKANIKIEAVGFDAAVDRGAPAGKDNHTDRQVYVDIEPLTEAGRAPEKSPVVDGKTVKDLTEPPAKSKEYDFGKEVRDRLKEVPDIIKGRLVKVILKEIGRLLGHALEGVHELKQANPRDAELLGEENALQTTTEDSDFGRGPHIQEGKPYTVQELKDRMDPAAKKKMAHDMTFLKIEHGANDQDLERGFSKAVDAVNRVLAQAHTPQERQAAMRSFAKTILTEISRNRQQRLDELRRR